MKKAFLYVIGLLFILNLSYGDSNFNWIHFDGYNTCQFESCDLIRDTIRKVLMDYEDENNLDQIVSDLVFSKDDFNKDGTDDYIVIIASNAYCGSAGCTTILLLSNKNGYATVSFPHSYGFQSDKALGFNSQNEFIIAGQGGCRIWKLKKHQLLHHQTINYCG